MPIGIYLSIILIVFLTLICFVDLRIFKTIYLILQTRPYEQTSSIGPTILILGDSTGYGTGVSKPEESIAGRIGSQYPDHTIKNNSKNGRTIGELLAIVDEVPAGNKLILLQIGGNDILQARDISLVKTELNQLLETLTPKADNLIMMSTGNIGAASAFNKNQSQKYESLTRSYREMFIEVTGGQNVDYVDLFVEPEKDLFLQAPKKYLAIDGLHPSAAGYGLWFQKLEPYLEKILRPR